MRLNILFFIIFGFHQLGYSSPNLKINDNQFHSLNESFNLEPANKNEVLVYGVISLKCPCSHDSLKAFSEINKNKKANVRLIVFDIGSSTEDIFNKIKSALNPNFDLRYDPEKKSVALFKSEVTPSAYIIVDNKVKYESAVINPGKNPSPNYLDQALSLVLNNKPATSERAFGCMIEK